MEKMLTTKQVAEIFGVNSRTVLYNFVQKGLKYFKIGNKDYRYTVKDVEDFIKKQTEQKEQYEFIDTRSDYQKRMNKKLRVV